MATLNKINILQLPFITKFYLDEKILFLGLLTEAVYDDGTHLAIEDPYLEYPQPNEPGEYECRIYLNKDKKDIYSSFKFQIFSTLEDLQASTPMVMEAGISKRAIGCGSPHCSGDQGLTTCHSSGDRGCSCSSYSNCSSYASNDTCDCTSSGDQGCSCSSTQICYTSSSKGSCSCSSSSDRGCGCSDYNNCTNSSDEGGCSCSSSSDIGCGCYSSQICSTSSSKGSCSCSSSSDRGCGCSSYDNCYSSVSDGDCSCTSSSDRGCGCSSSQICSTSSSKGSCNCSSSSDRGCGCSDSQACSCTASGLSSCVTCPSSGSATTKDINIELEDTQGRKSQIENITTAIIDGSSKTVGIGYWRSNNYNKTSTTAEMTSNSVSLNSGDKIGIDYYVLSESNFDKLNIYIYKNGSQVDSVTASGYNSGWSNKTYIISSSGNYSIKVQYVKDGSGNNGADRAWIRRPYYHINGVNYLFEFTNTGSYGFDELRYQKI